MNDHVVRLVASTDYQLTFHKHGDISQFQVLSRALQRQNQRKGPHFIGSATWRHSDKPGIVKVVTTGPMSTPPKFFGRLFEPIDWLIGYIHLAEYPDESTFAVQATCSVWLAAKAWPWIHIINNIW